MFGFLGGGGLEGLIFPLLVYGFFFGVNLFIQLISGGLSDLFPAPTTP
jgi:hypothetical protein